MNDQQRVDDKGLPGLHFSEPTILVDVIDIAERALWNPRLVEPTDVRKMAAAVVAHVRRLRSKA